MASVSTIIDLSLVEALTLMGELKTLDPEIDKKVQYVKDGAGLSQQEALEYVVNDSIVLWAKVYLDWEARDYQIPILVESKKAKKLVLRLGRRLGKCLPGDVQIPDPLTGEIKTVQELFEQQHCNIYTMNNNQKIDKTSTNIIFRNGAKPVYLIKTNSGKEIKATSNHPLYTINGYVEIDKLKIGDYVATPSILRVESPIQMKEADIISLAYMIGDGNCTGKVTRFSNINERIIKEFSNVIKDNYNCELKQYDYCEQADYFITVTSKGQHSTFRDLLRTHNVLGKDSHAKQIPKAIFSLPDNQLKLFLSRIYATDGWATCSFNKKARVEIGYCSVSLQLVRDLQHLLLRFGIHSYLGTRNVKYKGGTNVAYQLIICSCADVIRFADEINIFSKEEAVAKAKEMALTMNDISNPIPSAICDLVDAKCKAKGFTVQGLRTRIATRIDKRYETIARYKIKAAADYLQDDELQEICDNELYWEKIIAIEYVGDMETYDLTVPTTHNFVANDFITHNTENIDVSLLWHAFRQPNKGQNDKYKVLILTPFETQIDLIFDRLEQLISGSPILTAEVARSISHRYEFKNGTVIQGLTLGSANGKEGSSVRGQDADLLIFDEADYIDSKSLTNALNIANEDRGRIKIIAASTPSGRHDEFYKWCIESSTTLRPKQEDIDNFKFTGYIQESRAKGNGWTQIYSPSTVNKKILEINPDTQQTYLQDIKDELTDQRYEQEVMANFGEEAMGVYKKEHIQRAIELGMKYDLRYTGDMSEIDRLKYIESRNNINRNILIGGIKFIPITETFSKIAV